MSGYRGTVVSERSAEETFDYLARFSNAAEWDPGVAHAERLDDDPIGLGATFRLGVRIGSRVIPLDYRIVAYDRPRRIVLLGESRSVRSEDTVTVAARPEGGSVLTYDADLRLLGALAVLNPLFPLHLRRVGDRGLGGLRRVLSGPSEATPDLPPVVWLATAPGPSLVSGRFWLDRRPRWEHKVPWTRLDGPDFVRAGATLWAWCADRAGWDGLPSSA
jgi:Polyketide cyclase / dehydrase and lipid transport